MTIWRTFWDSRVATGTLSLAMLWIAYETFTDPPFCGRGTGLVMLAWKGACLLVGNKVTAILEALLAVFMLKQTLFPGRRVGT